jgi:GxxExxY protein
MMTGDRVISENRPREWKKDRLSQKVISSIIQVHQTLGPGFLESIYHKALLVELREQGLPVETERKVVVRYKGVVVGRHRLDLVVQEKLIVEVKTVSDLSQAHYSQARSYLRAVGLRVAILVNFAKPMADYRRVEIS